jgi:hypothetical protein
MAGVRDKQLQTFSSFPVGVNNQGDEGALPRDQVGNLIALREAVNLDISDAGKASTRDGYRLVTVCTRAHSAWSDDYLPFGFMVDAGTLYVVHADLSRDALVDGLAMGLPVSYTRINDQVLWTNGVQSGMVTASLELAPWCCPHPNGQPTLTLQADGALDAGTYQVTVAFLDAFGRESGCARAVMIDVPQNGAIALSQIPQPPIDGRVRIYATGGHDGSLRAAVTLPYGMADYVLAQRPQGRPCDTLLLRPMPAGQLVAYGNGRQFVARGKQLLFSPTLRYGMLAPTKNHVSFVGRIDMIAFVGDGTDGAGLFVSDGKRTYFMAGADPAQWRQPIAYGCGARPGQIAWMPGDVWGLQTKQLLPVWIARDGRVCVGQPGGDVYLPQPRDGGPDALFDQADSTALYFKQSEGDSRLVAAMRGAQPQALTVRDRLIVREYRHES